MTGNYKTDFPYVSPCGREMNYIRCDDLPIVFSQLLTPEGQPVQDIASYGDNEEGGVTTCGSSSREEAASYGGSERHSAASYGTNSTGKQGAASYGTNSTGKQGAASYGTNSTGKQGAASYGTNSTGKQDAANYGSERSVTGCVSERRVVADSVSEGGASVISEEKQNGGGGSHKSAAQSETMEEAREMEKNSSRSVTSHTPETLQTSVHPDTPTIQPAGSSPALLAYGGTPTLTVLFQPHKLCMLPGTGRVYHPGPEKLGGVGLVKSSLAIELSQFFTYGEGGEGAEGGGRPTGFKWRGREWELDDGVLEQLQSVHSTTNTTAGASRGVKNNFLSF